jgi:N-methylhydantoinase A
MVDGISIVSVQRGEDPRRYTLVVAGGAGAVHSTSLAKVLGIKRLLIPRTSSVFCALGGVIADIRHDFVKSITSRTGSLDLDNVASLFEEMNSRGDEYLDREVISVKDRYYQRSMDMRYKGQYHELEVPVPPGSLIDEIMMEQLIEDFHKMHETLYSYREEDTETEILNLRLAAYGKVRTPDLKEESFAGRDASNYGKGERKVFFEESGGFVTACIFDGEKMEVGNVVTGPAIVELETTTIVVPPDADLEVTGYGSFLVELMR